VSNVLVDPEGGRSTVFVDFESSMSGNEAAKGAVIQEDSSRLEWIWERLPWSWIDKKASLWSVRCVRYVTKLKSWRE
jgi:hypothetical protein